MRSFFTFWHFASFALLLIKWWVKKMRISAIIFIRLRDNLIFNISSTSDVSLILKFRVSTKDIYSIDDKYHVQFSIKSNETNRTRNNKNLLRLNFFPNVDFKRNVFDRIFTWYLKYLFAFITNKRRECKNAIIKPNCWRIIYINYHIDIYPFPCDRNIIDWDINVLYIFTVI